MILLAYRTTPLPDGTTTHQIQQPAAAPRDTWQNICNGTDDRGLQRAYVKLGDGHHSMMYTYMVYNYEIRIDKNIQSCSKYSQVIICTINLVTQNSYRTPH